MSGINLDTLSTHKFNNFLAIFTGFNKDAICDFSSEAHMRCKSCGAAIDHRFRAEMGIHFPGLKNIDKPVVWVFPELVVCLVCGVAKFVVPEDELAELRRLAKGNAASSA